MSFFFVSYSKFSLFVHLLFLFVFLFCSFGCFLFLLLVHVAVLFCRCLSLMIWVIFVSLSCYEVCAQLSNMGNCRNFICEFPVHNVEGWFQKQFFKRSISGLGDFFTKSCKKLRSNGTFRWSTLGLHRMTASGPPRDARKCSKSGPAINLRVDLELTCSYSNVRFSP